MIQRRFLVCALVLIALLTSNVQAAQLRVAVASNFLFPVKNLAHMFEAQSGHSLRISAGSTGKLYAQIVNGAPFDVFLAANSREPRRLETAGMIVPGSRFTYALGCLALWGPQMAAAGEGLEAVLGSAQLQRLAVANPVTAPYGAAAIEVLEKLDLHDALKERIIRGENVSQAYQYVASGAAQLGFVALSQIKSRPKAAITGSADRYWLVEPALYAPIQQQVVILKRAEGNVAAHQFLDFLKSPAGRSAIEASGYGVEQDVATGVVKP
jgi:molybdate transport system substrate-binding protein